jgi:hypothetical protein
MTTTLYFPEGGLKRIHVNQANLRRCAQSPGAAPCYTLKYRSRTHWATEVEILGPSRLVERISNPLGCGARLWIETTSAVRLHEPSAPATAGDAA